MERCASGTPWLMARYAVLARAAAPIIGGCCGTTAEHVLPFTRAGNAARSRPTLAEIEAALGHQRRRPQTARAAGRRWKGGVAGDPPLSRDTHHRSRH